MILMRIYKRLFKTSYIIVHDISDSQSCITDLCNRYNSLFSKIKIPICIHNLKNLETLNYSNVKKNYSTITAVESIQFKENLLHENINNGSVNLKMITSIIEDFENNACDIPETLSLKLLRCCGHVLYDEPLQIRRELANRVWNLLKNTCCNLTLNHYHALLQTFIDNDYHIDPKEFLESMKIKPQYNTYCLLLQVLPNTTDCTVLESLITDISKADSHYDMEIYNALVYAYAKKGNTKKAKDVIELMKEQNIQPSATTYMYLTYAFVKNNDIESALDILLTYKPSKTHIIKLTKFLSLSGNGIHIPDILNLLEPLTVEDYSVISVVVQLVHAGHYLDAYKVITNIPVSNEAHHIKETLAVYFLEEVIKLNIDYRIKLQVINDFATEQRILNIWEKAALLSLKRTDETLAIAIFNKMKETGVSISCDCFWPFFLNENVCDRNTHIYSIIKQMIALDVKIDSKTFTDYIFPYIDTSNPQVIVQKMRLYGISLKCIIDSFAIFLLNSGRLKETINLCRYFKKKIDCIGLLNSLYFNYARSEDIDSCIWFLYITSFNGKGFAITFLNKLLDHSTHSKNNSHDIVKLLIEMKNYETVISPADMVYIEQKIASSDFPTKNYMLQLISAMTAKDSSIYNSRRFIHSAYMNTVLLLSHFHELKFAGKNTRGIIRKLLMVCCHLNETQLNEILQEMNSNNYPWTSGMKISLFNYYVENNKIDEALVIFDEIHSQFPLFKIDNYKILNFATLLIKHDRINEAFIVLSKTTINHGPLVHSTIDNLLNVLARKDTSNYTKRMIDLLVEQKYCDNYDRILKYLVRTYIFRNDIQSAADVFIVYAERYKKTPAKIELLTMILKLDSSPEKKNLLENISRVINKIHGEEKLIVNLVIACSLCNKKEKLQNLFKKYHVSQKILLRQLRYLNSNDIITTTLRILENVEDKTKIKLDSICQLALEKCNELDDNKHRLEILNWLKKGSEL